MTIAAETGFDHYLCPVLTGMSMAGGSSNNTGKQRIESHPTYMANSMAQERWLP
jgi:hypothetical protein